MKDNLPYFEHDNNASLHPKMKALISKYDHAGYGKFWILNEMIARSPGAFFDISRKVNKLDLANELRLSENELDDFIGFLSDPEIDLINIQDGIITTDRVTESFMKLSGVREYQREKKRRKKNPPGNNDFLDGFPVENGSFPLESDVFPGENDTDKIRSDKIRTDQTIQDQIIQDKTRQDSFGSGEPTEPKHSILSTPENEHTTAPPNYCPTTEPPRSKPKPDKPKKPRLREREPVNDMEKVEKAYLQNWDMLYSQQRVETAEPVVTWGQTRTLLKKLLVKLKPEQLIQAINNGLNDEWIMNNGYSLGLMLSAQVLNRLINATKKESSISRHQQEKPSLE